VKTVLAICLPIILLVSCHKGNKSSTTQKACDIQQVYADNARKVTIVNGVWGTVSSLEGDCMPTVPPRNSPCLTNRPVQRTVKVFQYTTLGDAVISIPHSDGFFDSFNTSLVTQIDADESGFFQADLSPGHYSIAIVENGKLYANKTDAQGGLTPISFSSGIRNVNLTMAYKISY
jgi:hypothetical protein